MKADKPIDSKKSGIGIIPKGLAAILIPVVMQLGCILSLYLLVEKTERLAAVEAVYSEGSDVASRIVRYSATVASERLQRFYRGEKDPVQAQQESKRLQELEQQAATAVSNSKEMGISSSMHQQFVEEAQACIKDLDRLLKALDSLDSNDSGLVGRLSAVPRLEPLMVSLHRKLEHFDLSFDKVHEAVEQTRQAQAAARAQIKAEILTAVAIEVTMTILLVFLFLKNIRDRLKILIGNAQLIPKDQPITVTVPGGDELAYLDNVLHSASESLHKAAEHKRSLMEMVAHDLRTPLMSARLISTQLITSSQKDSPNLTPSLRDLRNICSLVITFVEDLLTIDKLEAGKLQLDWDSVDLPEVYRESLEYVNALAKAKDITVIEKLEPIKVLADRQRLLQVFNNLLSNAIKYSPKGSEIIVATQVENNKVKVSISDKGPGIEKGKQDKLFDKFYQADERGSKQGYGLGLAISRLIVNEHNGGIGVDSEVGQGSIFWFTLPLDKD